MYQANNHLFNFINPLAAAELKENARMPPLNQLGLMNYLSTQAIIERLYQTRLTLEAQVAGLQDDVQRMETQLKEKKKLLVQKKATSSTVTKDQSQEETDTPEKRKRRKARDVRRSHLCPVTNCKKSYGSGASVYLHIRLKHSPTDLQNYKDFCSKNKQMNSENSSQKYE